MPILFINVQKEQFWKKKLSLTILLSSLGFTSLYFSYFLVSLVFTLNFTKHDCNGGEKEETYFSFSFIHVFVHTCKAYFGHSSLIFARRMGEVCSFEHDSWENGLRKKSIWSQEQMYRFIDRLLVVRERRKNFRKFKELKWTILHLKFRVIMLVQEMITLSLHRLGSSLGFQNIGDLYRFYKNALYKIIKEIL